MMYSIAVKLLGTLEGASQTAKLYHKMNPFEVTVRLGDSNLFDQSLGTRLGNLTCRFEKAQHQ